MVRPVLFFDHVNYRGMNSDTHRGQTRNVIKESRHSQHDLESDAAGRAGEHTPCLKTAAGGPLQLILPCGNASVVRFISVFSIFFHSSYYCGF